MLNKKIKELRLRQSLTQDELAKELNISPSTVSMYENNAREPDLTTLINIAKFFNVTTDYLLGLSDNLYFDIKEPTDFSSNYMQELARNVNKLVLIVEQYNKKNNK